MLLEGRRNANHRNVRRNGSEENKASKEFPGLKSADNAHTDDVSLLTRLAPPLLQYSLSINNVPFEVSNEPPVHACARTGLEHCR